MIRPPGPPGPPGWGWPLALPSPTTRPNGLRWSGEIGQPVVHQYVHRWALSCSLLFTGALISLAYGKEAMTGQWEEGAAGKQYPPRGTMRRRRALHQERDPMARPADARSLGARRWGHVSPATGLWLAMGLGLLALLLLLTPSLEATLVLLRGGRFAEQEGSTTVARIITQPGAFYGRAVRVVGTFHGLVGRNAFTIEDGDPRFGDELLVVSATTLAALPGWPTGPAPEVPITVTGTVRPFTVQAMERELAIDLDDRLFAGREQRPVIVADSVGITLGLASSRRPAHLLVRWPTRSSRWTGVLVPSPAPALSFVGGAIFYVYTRGAAGA